MGTRASEPAAAVQTAIPISAGVPMGVPVDSPVVALPAGPADVVAGADAPPPSYKMARANSAESDDEWG